MDLTINDHTTGSISLTRPSLNMERVANGKCLLTPQFLRIQALLMILMWGQASTVRFKHSLETNSGASGKRPYFED